MSSFQIYLFGYIILVIGLGAAAYLLGVPAVWIAVGVVILIGIGIMAATSRSGPQDPQGRL
jgi:membrane-bound acyltransferase YfiQ involved in biofilm formation